MTDVWLFVRPCIYSAQVERSHVNFHFFFYEVSNSSRENMLFNPPFKAYCKDVGFSFLLRAMLLLDRQYVWTEVEGGAKALVSRNVSVG